MAPASESRSENAGLTFEDLLVHRESIFRICLGFCRDYTEAEDLAQDVYLKACRSIAALEDPGVSKEWLCRIAKNTCLDRTKKIRIRAILLRRWAQVEKPSDEPESACPADERLSRLKAAIRRLPEKLRSVFILRIYGHLAYEEIAAILDLPRGTVMSRLNRARAGIAEMLEEKTL